LSYQFNRFLKLGSGIGFREIVTTNNYTHQENEIPVIDSATGQILGYIPTGNPPPISVNAHASNSFRYIVLPVSLFYEQPLNSKWSVSGEFVNSFNFLLQQNSYLVNSKSLELQASDQNTFNPMVVSYQFRFGINYSLTPKLKAAVEPSFRGHYTNFYNSEDIIWKPKDFAFNLALIYSFKK